MFIITLIGGNIPILVPFLISIVGYKHDANISFQAESIYTSDNSGYHIIYIIYYTKLYMIYIFSFNKKLNWKCVLDACILYLFSVCGSSKYI